MWDDIYEYLFGGFESLVANEDDDEDEYDELDTIPSSRKTRDGYLKDGFVVDAKRRTDIREEEDSCGDSDEDDDDDDSETDDSSDDDEEDDDDICEKSEEESDEGDADCFGKKTKKVNNNNNKNIIIEKNKDKIPIVSSRLVSGGDNKIKNIKDKAKDKYKEKDIVYDTRTLNVMNRIYRNEAYNLFRLELSTFLSNNNDRYKYQFSFLGSSLIALVKSTNAASKFCCF